MKSSAILFTWLCLAGLMMAQDKTQPRLVKVVGTAEVRVTPDRAVISVGVEKHDPTAGAAKRSADAAARQILAALHAGGVDAKDIQTTFLSLQPQSYIHKGVRTSYFSAEETLDVTVRDLAKLDSLLESLVRAGGNRIDSVRYETSDLRKYQDEARDLAVKAAREKAQALAQALGLDIGKAHAIEEDPGDGSRFQEALFANVSKTRNEGPLAPSLAPGQKTISASVAVSFDLN